MKLIKNTLVMLVKYLAHMYYEQQKKLVMYFHQVLSQNANPPGRKHLSLQRGTDGEDVLNHLRGYATITQD